MAVPDLKVQPTSRIAHIREKVPSCTLPSKPAPQSSRAHSLGSGAGLGGTKPGAASLSRLAAAPPCHYLPGNCCWPGGPRAGSATDSQEAPEVRVVLLFARSRESKDGPWKFSDCRKRSLGPWLEIVVTKGQWAASPRFGAHNFRPWSRRLRKRPWSRRKHIADTSRRLPEVPLEPPQRAAVLRSAVLVSRNWARLRKPGGLGQDFSGV